MDEKIPMIQWNPLHLSLMKVDNHVTKIEFCVPVFGHNQWSNYGFQKTMANLLSSSVCITSMQ